MLIANQLGALVGGIGPFLFAMWLMTEGLRLAVGAALSDARADSTRTRLRALDALREHFWGDHCDASGRDVKTPPILRGIDPGGEPRQQLAVLVHDHALQSDVQPYIDLGQHHRLIDLGVIAGAHIRRENGSTDPGCADYTAAADHRVVQQE